MSKILVVDDSATDLARIQGIVSAAGCSVLTATNGSDAIEKARVERPEAIFLDIVMPEMDGYEACRKLTSDAATKDIPVFFVSSKSQKADRVWALMQGAKDLVSKPYDDDDILSRIGASGAVAPAPAAAPAAVNAEAQTFMLEMLGAFTNPVRVRAIREAVAGATSDRDLVAQADAWHGAIAESPNGLAEVDALRARLNQLLGA